MPVVPGRECRVQTSRVGVRCPSAARDSRNIRYEQHGVALHSCTPAHTPRGATGGAPAPCQCQCQAGLLVQHLVLHWLHWLHQPGPGRSVGLVPGGTWRCSVMLRFDAPHLTLHHVSSTDENARSLSSSSPSPYLSPLAAESVV